jgi:hypothetical protein
MTMTQDTDRILEAGRAIRPYLSELIGTSAEAQRKVRSLDTALADALLMDDQQAGTARVETLLTEHQATASWLLDFAMHGRPPDLATRSDTYLPLAGYGTVIGAPRFRCPHNDYVWFRRSAVRRIPICPTHGVQLVPDSRDEP